MVSTMEGIMNPNNEKKDADFPHAPSGWTRDAATETASDEGIELREDHWEVVRALQQYFDRTGVEEFNLRELHDALDEKFHDKGGIKYLYGLLPGGPVAQGCRLAGLEPPAGAVDKSFGSVV